MFEFFFELLWSLIQEIVVQLLFEAGAEVIRALFIKLVDVDFGSNAGRLSGRPALKLGWYVVAGAAAGGASVVIHPAPVAFALWLRIAALTLMPVASGAALAAWDRARGRGGEGRGRAAFWAGVGFGVGYVFVRLVVAHLIR